MDPLENLEKVRQKQSAEGNWLSLLDRSETGGIKKTAPNLLAILTHDPKLSGLKRNLFAFKDEWTSPPPWAGAQPYVTDPDYFHLCAYIQTTYDVSFPEGFLASGLAAYASANSFDPLKDYLNSLTWDGQPRIATWLSTYWGAEDSEYSRQIGRKWLIGAVARGLVPGTKVDNMLILEGDGGIKKSSSCAALCPNKQWFWDADLRPESKDSVQGLQGRWIVEVGELTALRRDERATFYRYLTCTEDKFRPSHGRNFIEVPRRSVFVGTTNGNDYLLGDEAERRFWPIKVSNVDLDKITKDRDQLWAEAVVAFKAGEPHWTDENLSPYSKENARDRIAEDPWAATLHRIVASMDPKRVNEQGITTAQILDALEIPLKDQTQFFQKRAATLLKNQGFTSKRIIVDGRKLTTYVPQVPLKEIPVMASEEPPLKTPKLTLLGKL